MPPHLLGGDAPPAPGAALSSTLRQALAAGALRVDYRPEVTRDGTLRCVEAVLRWTDAAGGAIDVAPLLAVVDSDDVVARLSGFLVEQVLRQCDAWRSRQGAVPIAVDVSAFVRGDAADAALWALLRRARIPNEDVMLGIGESSLGRSLDAVGRHLSAMRQRGLRVSLDSFDSSSSSLDWITGLQVDTLKLNASFTKRLVEDRRRQAMVSAVTRLASALALDVVAENVERREQLDVLASLDVNAFQGPLFHGPEPGSFWTPLLGLQERSVAGWEITAPGDIAAGS